MLRTVAIVGLLLPLGWLQSEFTRPSWVEPIEPVQIADDLYWVGSADLAALLFTSDEGHVLIDVPLEENVELVLGNVRALGFDPADIELLLASHAHFDHVGGLKAMREATGAEIALSLLDAGLAATGGSSDFFFGQAGAFPRVAADRILRHLDTVRVGPHTLTAHLTPGHTRGCTTWSGEVTIEGESRRFVSVCSLSVLPGYVLVGEEESYPGIARDFCGSLEHLRTLEPDIFLAPHGVFLDLETKAAARRSGDVRAFVDRERYLAWLERAARQVEETLVEQGEPGGCRAVLAQER